METVLSEGQYAKSGVTFMRDQTPQFLPDER